MFERPQRGERAFLLHVDSGAHGRAADPDEFRLLAESAGAELAGELDAKPRSLNPRYLIGQGKLQELHEAADESQADVILVDHPLSPGQERNLEKALCRRVVDRTGLILDIFALRARTFEGKLQVELAQLRHLSTRLIRGWTHLERQKGGIGLRGPGETQLETDRRLLGQRIRQLEARLARISQRRDLARSRRRRNRVPTVSLVGYTNAGKSTLFNRLCDAGVYQADQLFATLDPTLRRLGLPEGQELVLADTVGFIRELPHELVAAFHSTLEETRDARLLLHVVDASDPERREREYQVEQVLESIQAARIPVIKVYNKTDILDVPPRVDRAETGKPERVWLSARTGNGVSELLSAIQEFLSRDMVKGTARLGVGQGRLRARLYAVGRVSSERQLENGGWELDVELERKEYDRLIREEQFELQTIGHSGPMPAVAGMDP